MIRLFSAVVVACSIFWSLPVLASQDDVVLSIRNGDTVTAYSLEDLQSFPQRRIETTTIWTDGVQVFTGVSLHLLLEDAGITSGTLEAAAVNDYAVDIPVSDGVATGPIIAFMRNNAFMSLRDKGPLWVVYPFDSEEQYRNELIYSRSIWQLNRITVK